ncbi:TetR/AcrR family transcriptional regulator [Streptomyces sp. NBC_01799]|uniref:TetR/AcrR family transcriptional regulator n=1 Tax=Streptomyces sp. NBC_01800 TaxID=2975945 RepID=UPI002DDBB334|nr:TetR/AcrR family transcriptional regulator [Streptomyces sp. NBC_01800]WSA72194.1 TetR/AcrR family transcriptional regulator [Streptomyces sp. NBC_01800]WSA80715.1 TetR/AcrR family transcriptional regulator [Streptomyces sp. NBC_01799]
MPATAKRLTARERILTTAEELFSAHGLRGVGVDRIIADSGVAKSTLYVHFPSKDELAAAYLRRTDDSWRGKLRAAALAAGDSPRDQLVGLFDAVTASYERHGFHGCPFINAAAESEPGSLPHTVTVEHKRAVRAWVRDLAEAAGADDPDQLALQLTLLVDGALAAGKLEQDPAMPAAAKAAARFAVGRSCPPPAI